MSKQIFFLGQRTLGETAPDRTPSGYGPGFGLWISGVSHTYYCIKCLPRQN